MAMEHAFKEEIAGRSPPESFLILTPILTPSSYVCATLTASNCVVISAIA